jgi:hypothetical protein
MPILQKPIFTTVLVSAHFAQAYMFTSFGCVDHFAKTYVEEVLQLRPILQKPMSTFFD